MSAETPEQAAPQEPAKNESLEILDPDSPPGRAYARLLRHCDDLKGALAALQEILNGPQHEAEE